MLPSCVCAGDIKLDCRDNQSSRQCCVNQNGVCFQCELIADDQDDARIHKRNRYHPTHETKLVEHPLCEWISLSLLIDIAISRDDIESFT